MAIHKRYLLGREARRELLAGAKIQYDLVSPTSGPKGRNIAYSRPWGLPRIINDGIEIAKEVGSEDDFKNVGIDLIREAAQNTVTEAGDGTTTSIILAYEILKAGTEAVEKGESPMVIRKQILDALPYLLEFIPSISTEVKTEQQLREVALISASGDEEIAEHVSKAMFEMGEDGIVSAEEGYGTTITSEITKGMQINKGYLDPVFKTDPARDEGVVVDPMILVSERVLSGTMEMMMILDEIAKSGKRDVVIFADVRGDALRVLGVNKFKGVFNILAVNPPEYQEQRLRLLEDIATFVGAQVVTMNSKEFLFQMCGGASHVSANKSATTIVGGRGQKDLIDGRLALIKEKQEDPNVSPYEKEKFIERLAKLSGGASLIKVGAKSETLKREKFEKTKDTIGSTKAALVEGIVIGGGMSFIQLAREIERKYQPMNVGQEILYNALLAPTNKLLMNSGKDEKTIGSLMARLLTAENSEGYNVDTDKIENLREKGIVDPTRVIRLALDNAAVVATSMLTAEGVITDVPLKDQPMMGQQQ